MIKTGRPRTYSVTLTALISSCCRYPRFWHHLDGIRNSIVLSTKSSFLLYKACRRLGVDMDEKAAKEYFEQKVEENPDLSAAIAAIHTLIEYLKLNEAATIAELRDNLQICVEWLKDTDSSTTAITSGCELFLRFITLTALDQPNFAECKNILVERGNMYLKNVAGAREKIARLGHPFIGDGAVVLTHSTSRVVLSVLLEASRQKKRFKVLVTESNPDRSGDEMARKLNEAGIPTVVILDASVGYIMEQVDLVLVGAEGVVESGGIINKIGTYQMGICAKASNKPFYVVVECFKFVRMIYPLNQEDLPNEVKYNASTIRDSPDLSKEHPLTDYTPPSYITLLFTDLGVLTPSAVSDELINLYL